MFSFKKTMIAVAALSTSAAFAGAMGPVCTPSNATVPCETTAWDFGIQALYLKTYSDADTGYISYYRQGGVNYYNDFQSDWGWAFRLEGSYHFSTGNDLNVNWLHYNKTTTSNIQVYTGFAEFNVPVETQVEPKFDAVNIEFGQHVDFGLFKDTRFHAGLQYARLHTLSSNSVNGGPFAYTNIDMDGVGPRTGLDMTYNFDGGFAVYGNGAATLLVGQTKFNNIHAVGSKDSLIPVLEAKLGAKYNYTTTEGVFTLDAGWFVTNYFNAQHVFTIPGSVNGESDFGLQGPYIGFKWVSL